MTCRILFGPIKHINPSVQMAYKCQSSFRITAKLYTYWPCRTLFGPIKQRPSSSFRITAILYTYWPAEYYLGLLNKGQSSFRITAILYTYWHAEHYLGLLNKDQGSFRITAILYTYWPAEYYLGLLNTPIHKFKWLIKKKKAVWESLLFIVLESVHLIYKGSEIMFLDVYFKWTFNKHLSSS